MNFIENLILLLGRIFLSLVFLWAGLAKVFNYKGTIAYMQGKKMPMIPVTLPIAIGMQLLGGLSIMFGVEARLGALLLILFIIPAALLFHDFWNIKGDMRRIEKTLFMKDLAILGGLLEILACGPGKFIF